MKIFISWSGETGRALAEILHQWLPSVIQTLKPYFSADDVAKGARWSSEIARELESSQIGLVIVTRDTFEAPWLMFEAGALSKNIGRAKVSPILFDLEPTDIRGPLVQFQAAKFGKADIKRVLRMINSELGDLALADNVLNSTFDMWWPRLESTVQTELDKANYKSKTVLRSERELLEELLGITRSLVRQEPKESILKRLEERFIIGKTKDPTLSPKEIEARLKAGGDLSGANMMWVNLKGTDLSWANLRGANLVGADLAETKLINVNLKAANLERAVLTGADVQGANISYVNFWCAQMDRLQNLTMVNSMNLANFYGVEGLSADDKKCISNNRVLDIDNYPEFLGFFNQELVMSRAEISDLFLWTAHPDFASYVPMLRDNSLQKPS